MLIMKNKPFPHPCHIKIDPCGPGHVPEVRIVAPETMTAKEAENMATDLLLDLGRIQRLVKPCRQCTDRKACPDYERAIITKPLIKDQWCGDAYPKPSNGSLIVTRWDCPNRKVYDGKDLLAKCSHPNGIHESCSSNRDGGCPWGFQADFYRAWEAGCGQ
jgi:hypothetical protein